MTVIVDRIENQQTHYIHKQSDYAPSITKQLPWCIKKLLSNVSSSKDIFYETTSYYEQCLANYGNNGKITTARKK